MKKVPPSEKLRKEIDEILSGQVGKDEDVLGLLIERSLKMMFHKILEKEVRDYLGRDHYERGAGNREGYRNGYETKRLKTAEGEIELAAPQLRDTEECYRSGFLGRIDSLSPQLKQLVVEMYVRGLSARDIEEALRDRETGKLLISKDGVSELTEEL
jgi:putative transposase